ncbi:MAG: arginine repressor [Vagococcus sp.]
MGKKNRQLLIKQIISQQQIERQEELKQQLKEHGIEATQATISRDIRELRIVKTHAADGRVKYMILPDQEELPQDKLKDVFQDLVTKVTRVHFMNIINTLLGTADVIAAELDVLDMEEIAGTIAGTDTIVLISKTDEDAIKINEQLTSYLN